MAFKTDDTVLSVTFASAVQVAVQVKAQADAFRVMAQGGSVLVSDLFSGLRDTLSNGRRALNTAKATPGMADYAKEQFNDPAYDITTEFTAMMLEIDSLLAWLETNFPQDISGLLLIWTFVGDGSGDVVSDTITDGASLAALISKLDTLIAAID